MSGRSCTILLANLLLIFCLNMAYAGSNRLGQSPANSSNIENIGFVMESNEDTCAQQLPGDANEDGSINTADVAYIRDMLEDNAPMPSVLSNADPNGDCVVNMDDYWYLLDYFDDPGSNPSPVECTCVNPEVDSCSAQLPGDINADRIINIIDLAYLFDFLTDKGPAPPILANGDPNGDCRLDWADFEYLVNFLFIAIICPEPVFCTCREPTIDKDSCNSQSPGDVDNDGDVDYDDLQLLRDYYNRETTECIQIHANTDPDGDCYVSLLDLEYLQNYLDDPDHNPPPVNCTCQQPEHCDCLVGDANDDKSVNIGDGVYIRNFVFREGSPEPEPYDTCSGDANFDCKINIGDEVFINNLVFHEGPEPPSCREWCDDPVQGCGYPIHKKEVPD